jgi:hypothetical protein
MRHDVDWEDQIDLVALLLDDMGYAVREFTDADDCVDLQTKEVHIDSRPHPETRFYTLLHELGHVLLFQDSEDFEADHPMYVNSPTTSGDGRTQRSKAYRVCLLSEEIEAWRLGRRRALEEGLRINSKKYNRHMTDALMGYINWVADK